MTLLHEAPAPYWFARPAAAEELDVVIVGAGFVGLSAAWWCARAGVRAVVLESGDVAAGATGRSTGFLVTGGLVPFRRLAERVGQDRALRFWDLSRDNTQLVRDELIERGLIDADFVAEGSWRTAPVGTAGEAEWEESGLVLRAEGFDVEWQPPSEVRLRTGSGVLGGALYVAGDGGLDPLALCRGLVRTARIDVRSGVRVRHLEPEGERVLLTWSGGRVIARCVVLAVNAAVGPLVPGLAQKVEAMALQGLAMAPGERWLEGVWSTAPEGVTLRQLADGTVLAAGGAEPAMGDRTGLSRDPDRLAAGGARAANAGDLSRGSAPVPCSTAGPEPSLRPPTGCPGCARFRACRRSPMPAALAARGCRSGSRSAVASRVGSRATPGRCASSSTRTEADSAASGTRAPWTTRPA